MHLYIKLAFCLALLTDKLSQPSQLRRNQPWSSKAREDKLDPAGTVQTAQIKKQARTTHPSPVTWPLHHTKCVLGSFVPQSSSVTTTSFSFPQNAIFHEFGGLVQGWVKNQQIQKRSSKDPIEVNRVLKHSKSLTGIILYSTQLLY